MNDERGSDRLDETRIQAWLEAYGKAWEARDPDAAAALFTDDAAYFETPFSDPFPGRAGIRDYWARVTADQRDVAFDAHVVSVAGDTGIAQWSAKFRLASNGASVELNGVFVLEFAPDRRVSVLREWWHAR